MAFSMEKWLILACFVQILPFKAGAASYFIGRGIADVTGLVAEGVLYGYANPQLDARGLHLRLFSRAFIVAEPDGSNRVAIAIIENCMVTQALHLQVMEKLQALYGDLYTDSNVMLGAIHSHATPGGMHTYRMYSIPNLGFSNQTFEAYADGIVQSIQQAHETMKMGDVYLNTGELLDASMNRSPASYDNNPEEEKAKYEYNLDKDMHVLRFAAEDGEEMGLLSVFPVHTTSMTKHNHLVSSDNKGYASLRMEQDMNPGMHPGKGSFVAAFAQAAEGDASPRLGGSTCIGTGEPCDYVTSTCPENPRDPRLCETPGPTDDEFEDTKLIGEMQYLKAKEVYQNAVVNMAQGPIDHRFAWVNMSDVTLDIGGEQVKTCRPAMGYSFAAGTLDGTGIPPFTQGTTEPIQAVEDLVNRIFNKSEELINCQAPKPVLLPSGEISDEWPWQPEIVPVQILRIGNIFLVGGPGEFTTMSARRVKDSVELALLEGGLFDEVYVIFVGLTNTYSSYVTTFEEYQIQRYEGGSTIYGPHTCDAYQDRYSMLAYAMATGEAVDLGTPPPDLRGKPWEVYLGSVRTDLSLPGMSHGDVISDVSATYQQGDTVSATFLSGNPRNDLKLGGTYLEVQRKEDDDTWSVVATDSYFETKFIYSSTCEGFGISAACRVLRQQQSNATVEWDIPANQQPGQYRLVHYGDAKSRFGGVNSYEGVSSMFDVVAASGKYFGRKLF